MPPKKKAAPKSSSPAKKAAPASKPAAAKKQQQPAPPAATAAEQKPLAVATAAATVSNVVRSLMDVFSQADVVRDGGDAGNNNNNAAALRPPPQNPSNNSNNQSSAIIDATAQLLHAVFLIAHTSAVQMAPRSGGGGGAASAAASAAANILAAQREQQQQQQQLQLSRSASPNGKYLFRPIPALSDAAQQQLLLQAQQLQEEQQQQQQAKQVRLSLRPAMVAAIQAVVPTHIVDADVLRRLAECRAMPAGVCVLQSEAPMPPFLYGANNSNSSNANHSTSAAAAAGSSTSFSGLDNALRLRDNASAFGGHQQREYLLLRSPVADENVPTEENLRAALKESGFTAADARMIWFGVNSAGSSSVHLNFLAGGAAAASSSSPVKTAAAVEKTNNSAAKSPSPKKTKTNEKKAAERSSGKRRQRKDDHDDNNESSGDEDKDNDDNNSITAAPFSSTNVPSDLAPFLSKDKQLAVTSHVAAEAEHRRVRTDDRIKERRSLEALVTTLNVVRSAVGPQREEAGVVSVLRSVSRALVQSGFTASSASSASRRSDKNNPALQGRPLETDGTVMVASLLHQAHGSSSATTAGGENTNGVKSSSSGSNNTAAVASYNLTAQLGATASANVSIFDDAVTQLQLLLQTENAAVFYRAMVTGEDDVEAVPSMLTTPRRTKLQQQQPQQQPLVTSGGKGNMGNNSVTPKPKTTTKSYSDTSAKSAVDFEDELRSVNRKPELLNGIVFFPHSESAVAKRAQFVQEIAAKIAALKAQV